MSLPRTIRVLVGVALCATGLQWHAPSLAGATKKLTVTARVLPACSVVSAPANFGMKCSKGTLWIPAVASIRRPSNAGFAGAGLGPAVPPTIVTVERGYSVTVTIYP